MGGLSSTSWSFGAGSVTPTSAPVNALFEETCSTANTPEPRVYAADISTKPSGNFYKEIGRLRPTVFILKASVLQSTHVIRCIISNNLND